MESCFLLNRPPKQRMTQHETRLVLFGQTCARRAGQRVNTLRFVVATSTSKIYPRSPAARTQLQLEWRYGTNDCVGESWTVRARVRACVRAVTSSGENRSASTPVHVASEQFSETPPPPDAASNARQLSARDRIPAPRAPRSRRDRLPSALLTARCPPVGGGHALARTPGSFINNVYNNYYHHLSVSAAAGDCCSFCLAKLPAPCAQIHCAA